MTGSVPQAFLALSNERRERGCIMTTNFGSVRIQGISGQMYRFRAYALDAVLDRVGGVFFITSRNEAVDGRVAHSRIWCGETSDLSSRSFSDAQEASFKSYGANCICVLPSDDARYRTTVEKDIHSKYKLLCVS